MPHSTAGTTQRLAAATATLAVIAVAVLAGPRTAAGQPAADDPPGLVGRLASIDGQVSFRPASDEDWSPATPNRPVISGDALWADANSRGEVDAGIAKFRFANQSEVDVVRLDDDGLQLRLPQGSLIERVRVSNNEQNEVDAPNAAIVPTQVGEYRIDVTPDGSQTTITVFSGAVQATAGGSSFTVDAQQTATVNGTDNPTFDLTDARAVDAFDQWSVSRDARDDRAADERRYIAEGVPGADDLDGYGRWSSDPQYGTVWYPTSVAAGWAPYHDGHWVWMSPWGWTWVDDAPWGWTPFHYGRWANIRGTWGWCPGRMADERPVYAPALVVFVGGGGPSGAAAGNVGWFPLGPDEVYRPAYPATVNYVRRINVTNVTNVTNITNVTNVTTINNVTYRNRGAPGALTVVPQQAFVNAQPVSRAAIAAPAQFTASREAFTAPAVAPTRASLVSRGGSSARATAPPSSLASRTVIALHSPPPAPVPFAAEQPALSANHGRPLAATQVATLRQSTAVRPKALAIKAAAPARPVTLTRNAPPTTASKLTAAHQPAAAPRPAATASTPRPTTTTTSTGSVSPPMSRQPAKPAVPPPAAKASSSKTTLDRQYDAERSAMETRHQTEYAHPPTGETQASLATRQDAEHRELDARYQSARTQGLKTLPPKPAGTKPATTKAQPPAKNDRPPAKKQPGEKGRGLGLTSRGLTAQSL